LSANVGGGDAMDTSLMGEANRNSSKTRELIKAHPWCIYCGKPAETTDHCPPKSFFKGRNWPDSYEYPACKPCNAAARLDEQALAVLFRADQLKGAKEPGPEFEKLARGLKNNQPRVVAEWKAVTGDDIRHGSGWTALNIGSLTQAIIDRFMIKLSKTLYYRHNAKIFDGVLYVHRVDRLSIDTTPEYLRSMCQFAPVIPEIKRNNNSLVDQFIYRIGHIPEQGLMYAVVCFGEQWIFQLFAVSRKMDRKIIDISRNNGINSLSALPFRHECFLSVPVTPS
jgi:hypothetical protein